MEQPPVGQPGSPEAQAASPPPTAPPPAPAYAPPPPPQKKRRGWVMALIIIGALILLSCCCIGTFFGWTSYKQQQAKAAVTAAASVARESDSALVPIDNLVSSGFSDLAQTDVAATKQSIDSLRTSAETARTKVDAVAGDLSASDKIVAEKTSALLAAQIDALTQAQAILDAAASAKPALAPAAAGWQAIQQERTLVSQSNDAWNKHTTAGVKQSSALLVKAMAKCIQEQTAYEKAAAAFPKGDWATYISYAKQRLPSLELSLKINSLSQGGSSTRANALIDRYNAQARSLKALYFKMSAPPSSRPVTDGIRRVLGGKIDAYTQARTKAKALAGELGSQASPTTGI